MQKKTLPLSPAKQLHSPHTYFGMKSLVYDCSTSSFSVLSAFGIVSTLPHAPGWPCGWYIEGRCC